MREIRTILLFIASNVTKKIAVLKPSLIESAQFYISTQKKFLPWESAWEQKYFLTASNLTLDTSCDIILTVKLTHTLARVLRSAEELNSDKKYGACPLQCFVFLSHDKDLNYITYKLLLLSSNVRPTRRLKQHPLGDSGKELDSRRHLTVKQLHHYSYMLNINLFRKNPTLEYFLWVYFMLVKYICPILPLRYFQEGLVQQNSE